MLQHKLLAERQVFHTKPVGTGEAAAEQADEHRSQPKKIELISSDDLI